MAAPVIPNVRVLASPAFKNKRDNPYNFALYSALEKRGISVKEFSLSTAIFERYTITHIHWPDSVTWKSSFLKAGLSLFVFLVNIAIAKRKKARIFWTVHNLKAHKLSHPAIERFLWAMFIPQLDATIHLSPGSIALALEKFPLLSQKKAFVVRHGHYRDLYPNAIRRDSAKEQLGIGLDTPVVTFVGQIKPYKNVTGLIRCFLSAFNDSAILTIAGKPDNASLQTEITQLAQGHDCINIHFGMIADSDMQLYLNSCDLAVFPYHDILNSGSAILALSFDRPILVPARGAMGELCDLIGSEWVMTFDGELTSDVLKDALLWATISTRPATCDLSPLNWENIGDQTAAAYREMLAQNPG